MSRRFIPFALALVTTLGVSGAFAQEEEPFGKAGVLNIASDLSLSVQNTSFSGDGAPKSITAYSIGPAADVFVINNLSIGAQILFQRVAIEGEKIDTIAVLPRVGYHIPLVPGRFGLWPKLEFGYAQTKVGEEKLKNVELGAFVPLLIHPVEHFHIGIGPFIETALSSKVEDADAPKETTIGIRTEIGGWWQL